MRARAGLGVLALICALRPAAARADEPLDLAGAVKLALGNNERARKAPLRIEAAEGQLDRARAAFLPSLTAGATGTLGTTGSRALNGSSTVTLSQPILSPSAFPLYSQARHQLESERWGAAQDKRLVAFDTARAFLVVLTSEHLLAAANGRLDRAKGAQQNAAARAGAQLASSNDVTRATIELASASREVTQAQASVARAYLELGFLVGRPVAGPLKPPDRTTSSAQQSGLGTVEAVRGAEARRADVRSAEEKTEALRDFAKEPLYRLAPTVAASAQLRLNIAPVAPLTPNDESVQLTLNWTIYDAGARYADRRTRLAQVESQALDEKFLRRSIATDVAVATATLQAARDVFKIAEDAVVAAQKNTAETQVLYEQGLAHAIEVTDAAGSRYDAEVTRETAQLAMEQAYLDLRFALGLDPIDDDAAKGAP